MSDDKYTDYEIINIPAAKPTEAAKWRYIESDWMVCVDGISKTAQEVNRKTGETRPYDYDKAMREMFGG